MFLSNKFETNNATSRIKTDKEEEEEEDVEEEEVEEEEEELPEADAAEALSEEAEEEEEDVVEATAEGRNDPPLKKSKGIIYYMIRFNSSFRRSIKEHGSSNQTVFKDLWLKQKQKRSAG